jgi:hypothetical protein
VKWQKDAKRCKKDKKGLKRDKPRETIEKP